MSASTSSPTTAAPSGSAAGTFTPAPQPHGPNENCQPPDPPPAPPAVPTPAPCPPSCNCPGTTGNGSSCLDALVSQQAIDAAKADSAKAFKTDLDALLVKANAAKTDYTYDKYQDLLKRWKKEDDDLVALIKKLVCAIPCWQCVIECEICPLYYSILNSEIKLNGDGTPYTTVTCLDDLQYWWTRESDRRLDQFTRVKAAMTAWEKPAVTIDKILTDNAKLIADAGNVLGPDIPKVLWDVFFRILPLHLAIAPPTASGYTTGIDQQYIKFCPCDPDGTPDDCCGPNVGPLSLRSRLVGPQPFLIPPKDYFPLLCCLATTRYLPAKKAYDEAAAELMNLTGQITKITAEIAQKKASLPQDAKAMLSKTIDCSQYTPVTNGGGNGGDCGCAGSDKTSTATLT